MTKEEYYYWLANIEQIGQKKRELLLQVFNTVEELFYASGKELEIFKEECCPPEMRFSDQDIVRILNSRIPDKIQEAYTKLKNNGIYFVSREDERYPDKLRSIYDAPYALYYKGSLPKPGQKLLAVIGARECSAYGREMARYLAKVIAASGVPVISGLARGIDSYAHEGALNGGGITYAVLGCGIDICYPKENLDLYMEIQKQGAVISEYHPKVSPIAGNFPMRNRIISGLSDAILVIEAREKSGSLITVDLGLEQGKEIYALPGKATDQLSRGCNNLIKMGAKLVTSPEDILEDFLPDYDEKTSKNKKNNKLLELDENIVYASLCLEPKHIEEIAVLTGLPMDILTERLLLLELKGFIRQTMKNYYRIQG